MKKFIVMLKEISHLISTHRLYFLAPTLILLGIFSFLFFKLGPSIIITFIYAGV
ncbi:MAG: hypothetical protein ACJ76H_00950 [Bacteriovoracaceae bacterium]